MPDRLLTVQEAAEVLGMSGSTLYRLINQQRVPYRIMPTGRIRLAPADISQILEHAHRPPIPSHLRAGRRRSP
ncbi:helix-turn-helix transcriptional regulator [Modestobacter sp. SYSU DS0875]